MRLFLLSSLCMTLFACNTILCRLAIIHFGMDPLSYTALRDLSAILMLSLLSLFAKPSSPKKTLSACLAQIFSVPQILCALSLFAYMLSFSYGLSGIASASGTLLINVSVQFSMLGFGLLKGLTLSSRQILGYALAFLGLSLLVGSSLTVPSPLHAFFMSLAGISWGIYSLYGKEGSDPLRQTGKNFLSTLPFALIALFLALIFEDAPKAAGVFCAFLAGSLASALGYVLWYKILPEFSLVRSAIIQLSVPVITALLAIPSLGEPLSLRLLLCAMLILGGIATTILKEKP